MTKIYATMAGTILDFLVSEGDDLKAGEDVVILESMKMEIPISTDVSGKIAKVYASQGDFVNEGDPLLDVES